MTENQKIKTTSHYAMRGDWWGYRKSCSRWSDEVYLELKKRIPVLDRLDRKLLSKSRTDTIIGGIFLLPLFLILYFPLSYFVNSQWMLLISCFTLFALLSISVYCFLLRSRYSSLRTTIAMGVVYSVIAAFRHIGFWLMMIKKNFPTIVGIFFHLIIMVVAVYQVSVELFTLCIPYLKHFQFETLYNMQIFIGCMALIFALIGCIAIQKLYDDQMSRWSIFWTFFFFGWFFIYILPLCLEDGNEMIISRKVTIISLFTALIIMWARLFDKDPVASSCLCCKQKP